MDDTMSSYSFSPQFYQRWTCAPEPIRAAITQELEDITTLLQTKTPFESFVFHTHDLDAHVDELYENHEAEQAIAKAIIEKQEKEQAAEQQRLEDEKIQAIEEAKRRETAEAAKKEQEKNAASVASKDNIDESTIATNESDKVSTDSEMVDSKVINSTDNPSIDNNTNKTVSKSTNAVSDTSIKSDNAIESDSSVKAIQGKASAAISLALKDAKLGETHQALIHELEMQIDDYLSEQMMLMSENLKSWLRAEVTQHLGEQNPSETNEEVAKKNVH
ncbi:hypothetical protein ACT3TH_13550 [Psychrobacter sp. AOP22-C1-C5]|uniref:hypothetical protein n=1 Tax=Psychrobacter sp. AOP22-C1-C5 TaxID=3457716 RepID=UPI004036F8F6